MSLYWLHVIVDFTVTFSLMYITYSIWFICSSPYSQWVSTFVVCYLMNSIRVAYRSKGKSCSQKLGNIISGYSTEDNVKKWISSMAARQSLYFHMDDLNGPWRDNCMVICWRVRARLLHLFANFLTCFQLLVFWDNGCATLNCLWESAMTSLLYLGDWQLVSEVALIWSLYKENYKGWHYLYPILIAAWCTRMFPPFFLFFFPLLLSCYWVNGTQPKPWKPSRPALFSCPLRLKQY